MNKFETILKLSEIKGILGQSKDPDSALPYRMMDELIEKLSEPYQELHDDAECSGECDCEEADECDHVWRPLYMIPGMFCPKCGVRDV